MMTEGRAAGSSRSPKVTEPENASVVRRVRGWIGALVAADDRTVLRPPVAVLIAGTRDRTTPATTPDRTSRQVERVAQIVAGLATAWLVLAVSWGLFARVGGGHEAQIASRSIVAENMLRWHIGGVVKDYTLDKPGYELYYPHHPWGTFWLITAFAEVLGRGTWVPRLVGVLMSAAIPPMLYGVGKALWGPVPGAITAVAYVVLPMALAFGNLAVFELPIIFSVVLTTWGYLRFAEHWQKRWMWVSLAGVVAAIHSDWQGVAFIGVVLFGLAVGALGLPRWFGAVRLRPFAEWWVLAALLSAACLLGYVAYFDHIGAIADLAHSESWRARGATTPLADLLRKRSYWIDVTFTPLVVTIGKIAAPIFLARVLFWRRIHEVFPLAILVMATLQYVKFTNGANVHIYWPMPFAPYWALSLGMLCAATMQVARRLVARLRQDDRVLPIAALVVFGLVALRILPDGIRGLRYAKATAGRFDEKGRRIFNDVDMAQAMEWMGDRMEGTSTVAMSSELYGREYRAQEWALHRPLKGIDPGRYFAGPHEERYFVGDLRFIGGPEQRRGASLFHLVTLGPYVFIDSKAPNAPLDAYAFDEREPNLLEWYFVSPTEPIRTIRPDPWATWELRAHYDQTPNPAPTEEPTSLEEVRIAHNLAVAKGDAASAEKWNAKLLSSIETSTASTYSDGTRLLGARFVRGVDPKLELYFLASGPMASDLLYEVTSRIDRAPAFSLVPADDKTKKYGPPFVLPPRLWRKDFIYVDRVDIRRRPGRESFVGFFDPQGERNVAPPRLVGRSGEQVAIMTLE